MARPDETAADAERRDLPHAAALLAYAGGLPLFIAAILIWVAGEAYAAALAPVAIAYGIVLLAFFGGVRWGIAVMRADGPGFTQLSGAVAPLAAALALILVEAPAVRLAALALIIPLLLWDDLRATRRGSGAPDWYLGVRAPLTIFIEISLLLILVRILIAPSA